MTTTPTASPAPSAPRPLAEVALVLDPDHDNVAVARGSLAPGVRVHYRGAEVEVRDAVPMGWRFAVAPIPAGEVARQYGQPFGRARVDIPAGGLVSGERIETIVYPPGARVAAEPPRLAPWPGAVPTFRGFRRPDGRVGTRNWVLVVPTSMCSSHEAQQIALRGEMTLWSRERYPNVDGVVALPHGNGCGCPDLLRWGDGGEVDATMRVLARYLEHPNVGAAMVIELGCEKTNLSTFRRVLGPALAQAGKPVHFFGVQQAGGTQATIQKGLDLLPDLLAQANAAAREDVPASELILGMKCGGSDAFSGITANPALGVASDLLVRMGGTSLITEVPEFFGAEHLFARRGVDQAAADAVMAAMDRYKTYAARAGAEAVWENPSAGNKEGGLVNIAIKSLGAVQKSGAAPVQGVVDYAETVPGKGLWLVYAPGYDQESTPALVAAGAQVVCFTTGRGTGIGNAIAPVVKIATNPVLARRMAPDMDVDASPVLWESASLESKGREILDAVLRAASGESVAAERNQHREFAIWDQVGISL